jgi:hypothetical protein
LQEYSVKPTSPVKQGNENDLPKYLQLSPKDLEGPIHPGSKTNLFAKCSSETENLLENTNNVLNTSGKRDSLSSLEPPLKDEIESRRSSTILALATSALQEKASTSSDHSPPGSAKKKTLGELAKEWNSNQVLKLML